MQEVIFSGAGGAEIFASVVGEGQTPVLLLNSLASDQSMWSEIVERLSSEYRLICLDYPGHGKSGDPDTAFDLDDLVTDAVAALDVLGIEAAFLCGISLGGMIAMRAAAMHPDRVRGLIAAHTCAKIPNRTLWTDRIAAVTEHGMLPLISPTLDRWFTPDYLAAHPERMAELSDMISATSPTGYAACCRVLSDLDILGSLPGIDVQTLVIHAEGDPSMSMEQHEEIARLVPSAKLEVVPGAHISAIEFPDTFASLVKGAVSS